MAHCCLPAIRHHIAIRVAASINTSRAGPRARHDTTVVTIGCLIRWITSPSWLTSPFAGCWSLRWRWWDYEWRFVERCRRHMITRVCHDVTTLHMAGIVTTTETSRHAKGHYADFIVNCLHERASHCRHAIGIIIIGCCYWRVIIITLALVIATARRMPLLCAGAQYDDIALLSLPDGEPIRWILRMNEHVSWLVGLRRVLTEDVTRYAIWRYRLFHWQRYVCRHFARAIRCLIIVVTALSRVVAISE